MPNHFKQFIVLFCLATPIAAQAQIAEYKLSDFLLPDVKSTRGI